METAGYDLLTKLARWMEGAFSILNPVDMDLAFFLFLPEAIKNGILPAAARTPAVASNGSNSDTPMTAIAIPPPSKTHAAVFWIFPFRK